MFDAGHQPALPVSCVSLNVKVFGKCLFQLELFAVCVVEAVKALLWLQDLQQNMRVEQEFPLLSG